MKTVFILGAGATREAGGPLMFDFLDKIEGIYSNFLQDISGFASDFEDIISVHADLQGIYAKSFLDMDNIETLFGAIEIAQILNKLGNRTDDEILKLRDSMVRVIAKTIELTVEYIDYPAHGHHIPHPYQIFGDRLREQMNKDHEKGIANTFSFLTFNYDVSVEVMLRAISHAYNYCLDGQPAEFEFPLLKLHGSINWIRCANCHKIMKSEHFNNWKDVEPGKSNISLLSELSQMQCCGESLNGTPLIVPPIWNKTAQYQDIAKIWRAAAKELADADNIVIVGYSLPVSDQFFKYLYALGSQSQKRIKRFAVLDTDNTGVVENNFRELIGGNLKSRLTYIQKPFSAGIDDIFATIN